MKKVLGVLFVMASVAVSVMADENGHARVIPEINPAAAMSALALLGGGVMVLRAYLKK